MLLVVHRSPFPRALLLSAIALAAGCAGGSRYLVPYTLTDRASVDLPLASREALGEVNGTCSGGAIFFIPYGDDPAEPVRDAASGEELVDGEVMAAAAAALKLAPGAEALAEVRVDRAYSNFLVWSSWRVIVMAMAVRARAAEAPASEMGPPAPPP